MAIRIDPEVMRTRAGQFRSEAERIQEVISNMDNLLSNLQSEWEGNASQSYAARYTSEFKPNLQGAQEMVVEIASALDKVAQNMQEQDQVLAQAMGA